MMTGNRGRMRIEGGGVAVLCSFLGRFLSCGREPVDFTRQKGWAPISTWPRLCPPVAPPLRPQRPVVARPNLSACLKTSFRAKQQQQFLETKDEI